MPHFCKANRRQLWLSCNLKTGPTWAPHHLCFCPGRTAFTTRRRILPGATSMGSPRGVPVPWHSRCCTSATAYTAQSSELLGFRPRLVVPELRFQQGRGNDRCLRGPVGGSHRGAAAILVHGYTAQSCLGHDICSDAVDTTWPCGRAAQGRGPGHGPQRVGKAPQLLKRRLESWIKRTGRATANHRGGSCTLSTAVAIGRRIESVRPPSGREPVIVAGTVGLVSRPTGLLRPGHSGFAEADEGGRTGNHL